MASIERTKTGYAVRWRLGGKRTGAPQTLTFTIPPGAKPAATLKLAQAAKQLAESRGHAITRDEVRDAVLGATPNIPTGTPTFDVWVPEYIATRTKSGDAQPDVLRKYERALTRYAVPRLGHLYLTEIDIAVISDWLTWLKAQRKRDGEPLAAESVRRVHAILHGCLGAAVPRYLSINPVARPAGARRGNPALPKGVPHQGIFLEPWEMSTIHDACTGVFADMVQVEIRTGLRLGELLVLRVRDLVLGGRRPHIKVVRSLKNDGSVGPPKSAKSVRDVTVSTATAGLLDGVATGKRSDALLFTAPRGGMWCENNLRSRRWLPAVAAAQRCLEHPPPLPPKPRGGPRRQWRPDEVSTCACPGVLRRTPRFHDLRHTHVSLLIEKGWQPKQIQARMGHAKFGITMDIYGHLWERPDAGQLDEVDDLLAGKPEPDMDELDALAVDAGRLAMEAKQALAAWRTSRRPSSDRILRLVADDEAC